MLYARPQIVAIYHCIKNGRLKLLCDGYYIFIKDTEKNEIINLGKLDEAKEEWEKLNI